MTLMQALLPRARRFFGRAKPAQSQKGLYVQDGGNFGMRSYMVMPGQPVWTDRNYPQFALEGYIRNVITHRAISMVATASASVKWKLYIMGRNGVRREIKSHPILSLLKQPSPMHARAEFFQALYQYRMISGNAFVQAVGPNSGPPTELHLLRPDRIAIIAGKKTMPQAYRYTINNQSMDFPVNSLDGTSKILHLRYFNPLNDWYGLSPIEAAAYSIDQHNQAGAWNQSLMQNGARPSGALVVRTDAHGGGGMLSEDQYNRVKNQIDEQFSGPVNAGRPLLLEGGLDWKEMSLTPKDMDFVQAKNSSARDIALAFGVPPQLLGIPGDNTYSNLQEARLALWEQTVMPLVHATADAFSRWLLPQFGTRLELIPDADGISVLADRNQATWTRVEQASFLTDDEKRAAVGYGPLTQPQVQQMAQQITPEPQMGGSAKPRRKRKPTQAEKGFGGDDGDDDGDPDYDDVFGDDGIGDNGNDESYAPDEPEIPEDGGNAGTNTDIADAADPKDSWGRPETLQGHFEEHGDDFGAATQEDYARMANDFLQDAQDNNYPTLIDKDGNIKPYDADSNTFGTYNSDHTTRSFYKPNEDDYFEKETAKVTNNGGDLIDGNDIPPPVEEEPIFPEILIPE